MSRQVLQHSYSCITKFLIYYNIETSAKMSFHELNYYYYYYYYLLLPLLLLLCLLLCLLLLLLKRGTRKEELLGIGRVSYSKACPTFMNKV